MIAPRAVDPVLLPMTPPTAAPAAPPIAAPVSLRLMDAQLVMASAAAMSVAPRMVRDVTNDLIVRIWCLVKWETDGAGRRPT